MARDRTPLTINQILAWADAHRKRTGRWPVKRSGPVPEARDENWGALDSALREGRRGLPRGLSLAQRLARDRKVRNITSKPQLKINQILTWADAHHKRTGKWPARHSGSVPEAPDENWSALSQALVHGGRGLPPGGSLPQLLAKHGRRRNQGALPRLTIKQILAWAKEHHGRTDQWPRRLSGDVHGAHGETWLGIDQAMRIGYRGFSGEQSLAKLFAEHRIARHYLQPPPLTVRQIMAWADAHRRRTGDWPKPNSGAVYGPSGRPAHENWQAIANALSKGNRGLDQTTLGRLLAERRAVRHPLALPRLKLKDVLAWADDHRRRTGNWPTMEMGVVQAAPDETWARIDSALKGGARWRSARTSLAHILARYRNKQHPDFLPRMTIKQVLAWADSHQRRTGRWPTIKSGTVRGSAGETWNKIHYALFEGNRGFRGGSSLPRLLEERRGVRNIQHLPRLTIKQILKWVDAHRKRTGRWPHAFSGLIPRSGGQTWDGVQGALFLGRRGLHSGNTIPKVLDRHRGVRNTGDLPALRIQQILRWADSHHKHTGKWPTRHSGPVPQTPGERWSAINDSLFEGLRGLRTGSSLPRLLNKHRGVRNIHDLPKLSTKQILKWADTYYKREKGWPIRGSGKIPHTGGETWESINGALKKGTRGMSGGWSLFRFINRYRRPERGL